MRTELLRYPLNKMPTTPGLRRQRDQAVLTQRELSEDAGVRRATVSRLENGGSARPSTIRKLANALRCSTHALTDAGLFDIRC
jgi:transcriptional regulator with XRE-family HTH domain